MTRSAMFSFLLLLLVGNCDCHAIQKQTLEDKRALLEPGKCVTKTFSRCLNADARCDILSRFYIQQDCTYQYDMWHEYFCPCETFACEEKQDFIDVTNYCNQLLESKCTDINALQDCKDYVEMCCPFPSLCPEDKELQLFATYDWQKLENKTNLDFPYVRLDSTTTVRDGKLAVREHDGASLGKMPQLNGARMVSIRFEDVTLYNLDSQGSYAVLLGGGSQAWWLALDTAYEETMLEFSIGGEPDWSTDEDMPYHSHLVKVADEVIDHFDSIEYRFDGTKDPAERLAIRYNDGEWNVGGWSNPEDFPTFPYSSSVQINDSGRTQYDGQMEAELGPIQFFSSRASVL